MHGPRSESSILRELLDKAEADKQNQQDKVDSLLAELDVECDVSANRTWSDTYYCAMHGTHFKGKRKYICPVGEFALELKKKYE